MDGVRAGWTSPAQGLGWKAACLPMAVRRAVHIQFLKLDSPEFGSVWRLTSKIMEGALLTGSCMCGSVAYEVDGAAGPIIHCNCQTCRKAHATAFSSVSAVAREKFRWTKGEELLVGYESSPGKLRRFCSKCGSHILAERAGQPIVLLRLGCLDTPITDRPKAHIWRSDGATWFDPKDQLPELPNGFA
jgi:hypothetical protein